MTAPAPLDGRDAVRIESDLRHVSPGYLPESIVADTGPTAALLAVAARFLNALADRVDAAPEKNRLGFLDQLGVDLLPAQAARVPVALTARQTTPLPNGAGSPGRELGLVPAGSQFGASVPGRELPLVFETEDPIGLLPDGLAQVLTVWPARDCFADQTSALNNGGSVRLFRDGLQPIPHHLYLGAPSLALSGASTVEIEFSLAAAAARALPVVYEYWDGVTWRAFQDFVGSDQPGSSFDGTDGFRRSGVVRLVSSCATTDTTVIAGVTSYWVRVRLEGPKPADPADPPVELSGIRIRTVVDRSVPASTWTAQRTDGTFGPGVGLRPDVAYAGPTKLDLTTTVHPFGPLPAPGSTFELASAEAFGRPGAVVTVGIAVLPAAASLRSSSVGTTPLPPPQVVWEYWNGQEWAALDGATSGTAGGTVSSTTSAAGFTGNGTFTVTVPSDAATSTLHAVPAYWWRSRLVSGGYGSLRTISWTDPGGKTTNTVSVTEPAPPQLVDLRISYVARTPWLAPMACVGYEDLTYTALGASLRWPGGTATIFSAGSDTTPTVYLGFASAPPAARVGLFADVAEAAGPTDDSTLTWEYWNGTAWTGLTLADESAGFTRPGILSWVGPTDSSSRLRSDRELHWLRGRTDGQADPPSAAVTGLVANAVWAAHHQPVRDENLGLSTGEPGQAFFLRRPPVLDTPTVEVRELTGVRAAVELPLVLADVVDAGGAAEDVRTVPDPVTGAPTEVWVRWRTRPHFLLSGATGRHVVLEHSRGRLAFGDGVHGRIPPPGSAIAARSYVTGGGEVGNVPGDTPFALLGPAPDVASLRLLRPGEGGADSESPDAVAERGGRTIRHRRQAVTAADYEALAREASPAVAATRALPGVLADGSAAPGSVTVLVVPRSIEARPQPSSQLRQQVSGYLTARAPAGAGVLVSGPRYLPVGVSAVLVVRSAADAAPALDAATRGLAAFLHPLTGGPAGAGWTFGRGVYASDVAALLGGTAGVDHVTDLHLLLDDAPQNEAVAVPPTRIVVAGTLRLRIETGLGSSGRAGSFGSVGVGVR